MSSRATRIWGAARSNTEPKRSYHGERYVPHITAQANRRSNSWIHYTKAFHAESGREYSECSPGNRVAAVWLLYLARYGPNPKKHHSSAKTRSIDTCH